ncbi:ABC1 family protein C10F6.14c [Ceratocystis fimbriata CBS 114723]|uniref:ABC1 family protein C10F6.14c n=1 Tax=Ceratocystis fimbriata CBS 114723 TaxID=1035309 RepID=A0A2C5WLC7_9PEZI|nr:ABC1 family protein C10F6.14c [Ceratocystis fimbriata CBS 114723]
MLRIARGFRPSPPHVATITSTNATNYCTRHCLHTTPKQPQKSPNSGFEPLRPPSPESLGKPYAARTYATQWRWGRRLLLATALGGAGYLGDRHFFAGGMTRSLRTFALGLVVAADYKLNFRPDPWFAGDPHELHRRNAERLSQLIRTNGGVYLKIGQAIAMQTAILPPEFQAMFARMFDDAPQDSWSDVEAVIREDFGGRSVEEVFGVSFTGDEGKGLMERRARASASVAQVHWAKLGDGREVAIKVQKRDIAKQLAFDLWTFKAITGIYSWAFELPLMSLVPYICERLKLETDFVNEATNSRKMRDLVNSEPLLRDRVYIPAIYDDLTTRRVMTAEWIEGVRLHDREIISRPWLDRTSNSTPGVSSPLSTPETSTSRQQPRVQSLNEQLKPARQEWRGKNGQGGLGVSRAEVMRTIVDLFAAQIFRWGVVHCDPHPGNMFVRRLENGKAQVVLIDHGLYVYMQPKFRAEYAQFWKALMTLDKATVMRISRNWGIGSGEVLASATLLRPYQGDDTRRFLDSLKGKSRAERQVLTRERMKKTTREFLQDETLMPRELIFIGRNMRIVQGINQSMGSPVNRVKLMGEWASRSFYMQADLTLLARIDYYMRHVMFKVVMVVSDVAFYWFWVRQMLGWGKGMEDEVEERMKEVASGYGVDLQHKVFNG